MVLLETMDKSQLEKELAACGNEYKKFQDMNLKLDMSRGKPDTEQLNLSEEMITALAHDDTVKSEEGIDCRNYGGLSGIIETKRLISSMVGNVPENVIIYGNSSLNVMYDTVARSMTHGVNGSTPWCKLDKVKFLCPVPGYDRHFSITEYFGIEMVNIPLNSDGPDMDIVEKLVSSDESIKGIWCVPKYANPTGISYSDEVVKRFASLKPAAADFRIYWDNAYAVHHLYDDKQDELLDIISECEKAGNPDMVYEFCSTSKITFPGSGVAAIVTSEKNREYILRQLTIQTIGHDKLNQLRHCHFFRDIDDVKEHMRKHADIMRPKFEVIEKIFDEELGGLGIAEWTKPNGGYFISFNAMKGCAKKIVGMCKDAGVVLTGAGATYPYCNDPDDSNIRIAPSYPLKDELIEACKIFVLCVKIVSIEKILNR